MVTLFASQAFCWGGTGHKITALIGEAYLTPKSKAVINDLLDGQRLVDVVNWADSLRGDAQYSQTLPYHYQNMPQIETDIKRRDLYKKTISGITLPEGQEYSPGVVEAILDAEKTLLNSLSSKEKKQAALKFLVHFVGDLHQPLHTGRAENRGGNMIQIQWRSRPMNLHALWDSGIINERLGQMPTSSDSRDPSVIYAQALFNSYKGLSMTQQGVEAVASWYRESVELQNLAFDEKYNTNQDAYYAKARPAVDARLFLAGRRMGETLNKLLDKQEMDSPNIQIIKTIENLFGKLEEIINFMPAGH